MCVATNCRWNRLTTFRVPQEAPGQTGSTNDKQTLPPDSTSSCCLAVFPVRSRNKMSDAFQCISCKTFLWIWWGNGCSYIGNCKGMCLLHNKKVKCTFFVTYGVSPMYNFFHLLKEKKKKIKSYLFYVHHVIVIDWCPLCTYSHSSFFPYDDWSLCTLQTHSLICGGVVCDFSSWWSSASSCVWMPFCTSSPYCPSGCCWPFSGSSLCLAVASGKIHCLYLLTKGIRWDVTRSTLFLGNYCLTATRSFKMSYKLYSTKKA